jgi:hypothetical protein
MSDNIRQYLNFKNMIKSNIIVELKIKIKDKISNIFMQMENQRNI